MEKLCFHIRFSQGLLGTKKTLVANCLVAKVLVASIIPATVLYSFLRKRCFREDHVHSFV